MANGDGKPVGLGGARPAATSMDPSSSRGQPGEPQVAEKTKPTANAGNEVQWKRPEADRAGKMNTVERVPKLVPSPEYAFKKLSDLAEPVFSAQPSLDGRYFAYRRPEGLEVVDLRSEPPRKRLYNFGGLDPAFSWDTLVTTNGIISVDELDRSFSEKPNSDPPKLKNVEFLGGYSSPNSQFMVHGAMIGVPGPPGPANSETVSDWHHPISGEILSQSQFKVAVAPYDEAEQKFGKQVVHSVPFNFDFTQASDGPLITAKVSRPTARSNGKRIADGYVVYSVDPAQKYKLTKLADIKGLNGGKAAIMDNLIAFHHRAEPGDFELFGFKSANDPQFLKLCNTNSVDVFVYDLSTNELHRATAMGEGKQAYFPRFSRGKDGEPVLTYISYERHLGSPAETKKSKHAVYEAVLKQTPDASDRARLIPNEVNVDTWGAAKEARFVAAVKQYVQTHPDALSAHQKMHGKSASRQKPDPNLLLSHRSELRAFETWLSNHDYKDLLEGAPPKLPAWRPNQPVPREFVAKGEKGQYRHLGPVVRTPTWLKGMLGSEPYPMKDPVFGHTTLGAFETPEQLSLALTSSGQYGTGYHGAAHAQVGGKFNTPDAARTPLFWLLHRHLDNILDAWLETTNGKKWLASPAGEKWRKA